MAFVVPEIDLDGEDSTFSFTHAGVEHKIPFMQHIPLPVLERAAKRGGIGDVSVLEELGLATAAAAWKTMSPYQMKVTSKAWTEESKASMGESLASSSS
jgi:hypothetical protein